MTSISPVSSPERAAELARLCLQSGVLEAVNLLAAEPDELAARVLALVNPAIAVRILETVTTERRERLLSIAPEASRDQWLRNLDFPDDTIGRLMEPALAIFSPETTVAQARETLRELVQRAFITYAWVTDPAGKLLGVIVFRELLFAHETDRLDAIMLRNPFVLRPETPLLEAMKQVLARHYPVYPVSDEAGRLLGVVRGQTLFEQQALEISAQAGSMVGVEKEERLSTPWWRSLRFRHPWLQFNLLTAFVAAAVVGVFEDTIERIVVLAVFLPVLAGQSGNTGCQALAVTLRGITLGEIDKSARPLVIKEGLLGLLNGMGTGLSAGIGMAVFAWSKGDPNAPILGAIVFAAMIGSCVASGVAGTLVPLTLRRLGFDPATASSIFLTTATDVASMGLFLGLATLLL